MRIFNTKCQRLRLVLGAQFYRRTQSLRALRLESDCGLLVHNIDFVSSICTVNLSCLNNEGIGGRRNKF